MSKAKKTWLPIIIVAALAAIIVMIALIVSPLNDEESAELKETPVPVESTTPEDAEPQESLSPEMQSLLEELSGGSGSKKSGSDAKKSDTKQSTEKKSSDTKKSSSETKKSDTKQSSGTQQTAEKKDPLTELQKGLAGAAAGAAESAGELVGKLHDISRSYSTGDVAGILTTPIEFAGDVYDFVTDVIGDVAGGKR